MNLKVTPCAGQSLTPIYCTVEIPPLIIDKLITRTNTLAPPILYPVDNLTRTKEAVLTCHCVTIPTEPFQTPFLNWTIPQLKAHYLSYFPENDGLFSTFVFIILDEWRLKDETCYIASIKTPPHSPRTAREKGYLKARADFYIATHELIPVNLGLYFLNEAQLNAAENGTEKWRDENAKEEGEVEGAVLYTRERSIGKLGQGTEGKECMWRMGWDPVLGGTRGDVDSIFKPIGGKATRKEKAVENK